MSEEGSEVDSDPDVEVDEDIVGARLPHHVPSAKAEATWARLLDYAKAPYTKRPFGPVTSRLMKDWSNEKDAANFRLPREDPCIRFAFSAARDKHDSLFKFSKTAANSAGASANALFAASEGVSKLVERFESIEASLDPEDPWLNRLDEFKDEIKSSVKKPIDDAIKISAGVFGGAVSAVRGAVVPFAGKVAETLKETPPSNGFFFGNKRTDIDSDLSIYHNLSDKKSATTKTTTSKFRKPAYQKNRANNASSSSSSSTSKSTSSSSYSRDNKKSSGGGNFRNGKGGKKSK